MKTVCFGEIMLRLSPPGYGRIAEAKSFDAYYGGAEANVAVVLAQMGIKSVYVTRLPENELGNAAAGELRRWGVDTRHIVRGGERIGVYFYERGAGSRQPKVIYDRAGSAFAMSQPEDYDWDKILDGAGWLHFSGITPALGENLTKVCKSAISAAKDRGITVSCDVNYRRALWGADKAGEVMAGILPYADVCVINEEHAGLLFGIKEERPDDGIYLDASARVAQALSQRFGCGKVAVTIRRTLSADKSRFAAVLYDKASGSASCSKIYDLEIIERIGGGDAFCAGLIYALESCMPNDYAVQFAAAACAIKHSILGDFGAMPVAEIRALADGAGRSER
ncbi:MAG TPA: sugar kinase [Bacillota bacterium]|nr:sugar kinase [Bacillota bacterium]